LAEWKGKRRIGGRVKGNARILPVCHIPQHLPPMFRAANALIQVHEPRLPPLAHLREELRRFVTYVVSENGRRVERDGSGREGSGGGLEGG
jgi:hypothetical protein